MNISTLAKWRLALALSLPIAFSGAIAPPTYSQADGGAPLTVRADEQEADARTGIVTARGNVQVNFPSRNLQATSNQAQFFSNEQRLVLTGNVFVLQEGNSIRGEVVTYLIDDGLFVAQPLPERQVEAIYLVPENGNSQRPSAPAPPAIR